jgi:hypothetical protein
MSRRPTRETPTNPQRTAGTPGEDCANVLAKEIGTATAPVMGSGFCGTPEAEGGSQANRSGR